MSIDSVDHIADIIGIGQGGTSEFSTFFRCRAHKADGPLLLPVASELTNQERFAFESSGGQFPQSGSMPT